MQKKIFQERLFKSLKQYAGNTIVECSDRYLSYEELDHRSNTLACWILERDIKKGTFIGILLEDRVDMISLFAGVMKAGCVIVPIYTGYPDKRIEEMIRTTDLKYIFCDEANARRFSGFRDSGGQRPELIVYPEICKEAQKACRGRRVECEDVAHDPEDPLYIHFTSGTTGLPKAFIGKNKSLLHFLNWEIETFAIDSDSRLAQFSIPGFDPLLRDFFAALFAGGRVCVPENRDILSDAGKLKKWIDEQEISLIHCVSTQFRLLASNSLSPGNFKTLRYIIMAGEKINPGDLKHWYEIFGDRIRLVNCYGTSETTMFKTCYFLRQSDVDRERIPVGKPIKAARIIILDEKMNVCERLVPGEIYIRTPYMSCGYYNDDALNKKRFVPNPFSDKPGDMIYRTGDQGRLLADGNLDLLGRLDRQVKIQGNRIELEEIESIMAGFRTVKEAVVVKREMEEKECLIAYIVEKQDGASAGGDGLPGLDDYLRERLPAYMVPASIVRLERIPLTDRGKLDYKRLPDPLLEEEDEVPPGDDIERRILNIWSGILKTGKIGINSNFFKKGGNSLNLMTLVYQIHREFDVRVPLDRIFRNPTIAKQAALIRGGERSEPESLNPAEKKTHYNVSPAQKRMYILNQLDPENTSYNITLTVKLENLAQEAVFSQNTGIEKLEWIFRRLIERHESLRISFETIERARARSRWGTPGDYRKVKKSSHENKISTYNSIEREPALRVNDPRDVDFKIEYYEEPTPSASQPPLPRGEYWQNSQKAINSEFKNPLHRRGAPEGRGGSGDQERRGSARFCVPPSVNSVGETIEKFIRPFDLAKAPLLRAGFIPLGDDTCILMVDMHHIISDGISLIIVIEEFMALYAGEELPRLQVQYKDYCHRQNRDAAGEKNAARETYWLEQFSGTIPVLDLPYDYPRPQLKSYEGRTINFEIDKNDTAALNRLALEQDTTLFMVLLAIYYVFLAKLSGREDIVAGTPTAGRPYANLEPVVGMFINTLCLRNYPMSDKSFAVFLGEVKRQVLGAFENQDYQFEDLVEKLDIKRDAGRNPLFDVMFTFQNMELTGAETPRLKLTPYEYEKKTSKFDFLLIGLEEEGRLLFSFEYCSKLFKEEKIARFIRYFKKTAAAAAADVDIKLSAVEILSEEEKKQIIHDFNNTQAPYPADRMIHELFAQQVEKTPDHIALAGARHPVSGQDGSAAFSHPVYLTYRKFNAAADRMASILREKGVENGTIVALVEERSIEMMTGIFGILKAGGAYLPIEPKTPDARKRYMLKDSSAKLLLTFRELASGGPPFCKKVGPKTFPEGPSGHLERTPCNRSYKPHMSYSAVPAYVIYTSGSTGKPKGVMIEHHSLVNRLNWMQRAYPIGEGDVILQKTTIVFDVSVWELFWWSLVGASLWLLEPGGEKDPEVMVRAISRGNISTMHFVPSMLNVFLQYLERSGDAHRLHSLRRVFASGEALMPHHVEKFTALLTKSAGTKLANLYGPTEATIDVSYFDCDQEEGRRFPGSIPIGRPIDNIQLFVVDKNMRLQGIGIAGELVISGVGVGRGYLNRPELTADNFAAGGPTREGARAACYKTGDLCRWLADGNIEFLGRLDYQVKIRGFRIELGEIENQLLAHAEVSDALVMIKGEHDGGDSDYLCAYVVPAGGEVTTSGLREYLSGRLPGYMVPAHFIFLESMPLTANGKVDRKALPEPELKAGEQYAPPVTLLETKLTEIWSEVLAVDKDVIGIDDNFFELGGHSLKATMMAARIQEVLGLKAPLNKIFVTPTIRGLAAGLEEVKREKYVAVEPVVEQEYYDLSNAQHRLWIICQFEEDSTAYNIAGAQILEGRFDSDAFREAMQQLVDRHESLRTEFITVAGNPKQRIIKNICFKIEQVDLRHLQSTAEGQELPALFGEFANRPFNLEKAPLFRVMIARTAGEKHLLAFNIHHIITDAWSQSILIYEAVALYNAFREGRENPLPALKIHYKDYAARHNRLVGAGAYEWAEAYWLEKFKDKPNGMELPLDHPRKAMQTFNGGIVPYSIDRDTTLKLKGLATRAGATLFMGIVAVLNVLLYKYTGQTDVIIGLAAAGRKQPELHEVVGFFVNTMVYRLLLDPAKSFASLLADVRQEAMMCYEYQDYPFNMLVEKLDLERDLSQSPLFNLMISQNNWDIRWQGEDVRMDGLEFHFFEGDEEFNMSVFDMAFFVTDLEKEERVEGSIMYNSDLFERGTIERLARGLETLLADVAGDAGRPVHALNYISSGEYRRIVEEFNDNDVTFPRKTVQELFEEQVEKNPEQVAVTGPGLENAPTITYRELNEKANRLAHYLRRECGVLPNDIAAIAIDRSIDLVVAILGVIKSGGGYLSIDPGYPEDRVLHMLEDSGCDLLLIDKQRPEIFSNYKGRALHLHDDRDALSREPADNPAVVNGMTDTIYVIYTSGSTGMPNGAMLSQDILVNLLLWQKHKTSIDTSLRCLQFTTASFCVSFQEIFTTLTGGGELYLIGEIERQDIDYLMDFLSKNKIENLYLPFSYLNFLFNESNRFGPSFEHYLKHIITAGEQLKITSGLKTFLEQNPNIQLHNHYGSSEMHVVTSYTLDAASAGRVPVPPAGKPIANTGIYILDEYRRPVPIGVWGELCIAGCSEIPGYINNEGLTNKKLYKHPVLSPRGNRLYCSGDLGRWLPDGNIELKGRIDSQVKIRGFRVELSEVEGAILAFDSVKDCVVEVKVDKKGEKCLVAYVVVDGADIWDIKKIISGYLPQHMIPAFMVLDSLPLMPNGKVDRENLPDPEEKKGYVREIDHNRVSRLLAAGRFEDIKWKNRDYLYDKPAMENLLAYTTHVLQEKFLGDQLDISAVDIDILDKETLSLLPEGAGEKAEPIVTRPRRQIIDFDRLPLPDRSLVDYGKYGDKIGLAMVKHTISIQATRGCPYNCLYCHKIWPKNHVVRSAENIFKELRLYYDMGFRRFVFVDDIFNLDVKNSIKFFRMIIAEGLQVRMFFPNGLRTDLLTPDYIDLMVEAGTVSIGLALETASPRLQKLIKKNMNLKKLRKNVEYLCEAHPRVILELFLMHGFPTETEAEAIKTLDFLKSLQWIDFPYLHILKIYPNTDMAQMAMENGVSPEAIRDSAGLAFHELPDTLPFAKSFTMACQADFLDNYFLLRERLLAKLPYQMEVLTENEIVQKYNSYLPAPIGNINDLFVFLGIPKEEAGNGEFLNDDTFAIPDIGQKMKEQFPGPEEDKNSFRVLLLDLSQYFSYEKDILYDGVEPPLGLISLLTYLKRELGGRVKGKIAKSRIDFDNFKKLRELLDEFKPRAIGLRTLTYYSRFFHQTVSWIRHWGFSGPIIAGGPYATSDYESVLQDKNIDLVVMSEGEITFAELIMKIIGNNGILPPAKELKGIDGLAFVPREEKKDTVEEAGTAEGGLLLATCLLKPVPGAEIESQMWAGKPGNIFAAGVVPGGNSSLLEFYRAAGSSIRIRLLLAGSHEEELYSRTKRLPANETEKRLAGIWAGVLGMAESMIGIDDNFFDLGGHSLKATTMISQIHKEMAVRVPLIELFKLPTIQELAAYIDGVTGEDFVSAAAVEKREYYRVSSAQQRLYIHQKLKHNDTAYNSSFIALLEGGVDSAHLEEVFRRLIVRHETLRTSLQEVDGEPVQIIHDPRDIIFEIEFYDVGAGLAVPLDQERREEPCVPPPLRPDPGIGNLIKRFIRPFDLAQAPLLRVGLVKTGDRQHMLLVDMHHVITDATSLGILVREFMKAMGSEELPALRLQYRDYSRWQNRLFASGEIDKQETYWLEEFAGGAPEIDIPTDFSRLPVPTAVGDAVRFEIERELRDEMNKLISETGTTLFILSLALCNILLSKYTRGEDIVIGTASEGRHHADLQYIIGMFVNTLALRNRPQGDKPFAEFLEEVKENSLNAFENQDFQFEELVKKLGLGGRSSKNPLFDTGFKVINNDIPEVKIPGLTFTPYDPGFRSSRFDLVITIVEPPDRGAGKDPLIVEMLYTVDLFKRTTIEDMAKNYIEVLRQVVENRKIKLKDIEVSGRLAAARTKLQQEDTMFQF